LYECLAETLVLDSWLSARAKAPVDHLDFFGDAVEQPAKELVRILL
jgi:hypothetical protein